MAQDSQDPHKNNMGFTVGPETDYGSWDWRKIMVAILGAVNTDFATAQDKLGGVSNPATLRVAATSFGGTASDMKYVYDSLKSWHDYLLNPDAPMWRGDAAEAFRGLMDKTLASVKGHLDPLTNNPTYENSLNQAADDLDAAIRTIQKQDADAAQSVVDTWNNDSFRVEGDEPWYDYNGTTIVMISRYPDIDRKLSDDMRGTLQGLVGNYKSHMTAMPAPAPLPSPDPGQPNPGDQKQPTINFGKMPPIKFGDPKTDKNAGKNNKNDPNSGLPDNLKIGPDGQLLGPDGKPIGASKDPNLKQPNLVNTPDGPAVLGPDGKTLLDPNTGKPLKGPDGKPLTVNDLPKTGVLPPGVTPPPPIKTVTEPNIKTPAFDEPPGGRPLNLTSGGPPKSAAELQSEGALKSGAKEFGPADEAAAKAGAAEGGGGRGGEPMPMGGGQGAGQGDKDRDRTTWLVEDEYIWGAETTLGDGILGR